MRTVDAPDVSLGEPVLPLGRRVELPRRGTTFVREVSGPPGAPTLLLLHGWTASGGMNWYRAFDALAERFHVIAPDLRGHARGLRSRRMFRLAECADDCAMLLTTLDTGPVIVAGYSMGGPVGQLLWRRHRDLVSGLVQCATSAGFLPHSRHRAVFQAGALGVLTMARAAAMAPVPPRVGLVRTRPAMLPAWAAAELRRHDWRAVAEAGHSIGTYYAGRWIGEVDVPTAVVCTTRDRLVEPSIQRALAGSIRGATLYEVDDGHFAAARPHFVPALVQACTDVAARTGAIGALA